MQILNHKYDVVISFSEAQKDIAAGICIALERLNINTYYYPYNQEENAGFELGDNLTKLFRDSAKIALAILSEEYLLGEYTQLELKVILERLKTDANYFIPILYENTELPVTIKKIAYIKWNSDPKAIANTINKRLIKKNRIKPESNNSNLVNEPNVITINRNKHEAFLADQRKDPVSKELIGVGDEVVVCKKCRMVFLKDIWTLHFLNIHCNQSETLTELPNTVLNDFKMDTEKIIEELCDIIPLIHFKLHLVNTELLFNKVLCDKDKVVLEFYIENKILLSVEIYFNFINLDSCKLLSVTTNTYVLVLESLVNTKGIIFSYSSNSELQDRIGFLLVPINVKNSFLIEKFYELLLKIIYNIQTKKG
ncbi:TIR domain protein [Kordia sp. SMS9]|uniref:toll/interleukin-1 receptor domain-containing protein n=1 Tax=Kordia sp. SMS9 TaxID=2282170 RepID=UPI000E0DA4A7|nr:toll/interleukin-1 receptor domain-containing protein [Kordia sp. SMS9]AXG72392.1 TIR domain protein [Kordia sp. SMS9]